MSISYQQSNARRKTLEEINYFIHNNTKFGFLELTGKYEFRLSKSGRQTNCYVETICDCGYIKYILLGKLKKSLTKSCGCYRKKIIGELHTGKRKYTEYKHFAPYFFKQIKKHLKRGKQNRIIDFNLTIQDLDNLYESQQGLCYYTGQKLKLPDFTLGVEYEKSDYNVSVDRVDSNLGYYRDNCVLCLKNVNKMKWNFNHDYFIELCHQISKTHN